MRSLEKFSMSNNEIHLMEISKRTPEIVTYARERERERERN